MVEAAFWNSAPAQISLVELTVLTNSMCFPSSRCLVAEHNCTLYTELLTKCWKYRNEDSVVFDISFIYLKYL